MAAAMIAFAASAAAKAMYGMYAGAEAAKAGDRQADAIEDLIPSTLLAAKLDKKNVTQTSYAKTLNVKDIVSGQITDTRIEGKIASDNVTTETAGSGVAADTGSTLDVQMSILNQARQTEQGLLAQMSIEKTKNAWEADQERKSIDRHTALEIQKMRARAKEIREQGKDAKRQAYVSAMLGAGSDYAKYKGSQ